MIGIYKTKPRWSKLNKAHPLAKGLRAAYPMHVKGGLTIYDIGPYGYHLTVTDAGGFSRFDIQSGGATEYPGTTNYAEINSGLGISDFPLTLQAIARYDSLDFTTEQISLGSDSIGSIYYAVGMRDDVAAGLVTTTRLDGTTIDDGKVHMITLTSHANNDHKLYVDGELVATDTTMLAIGAYNYFSLGRIRSGGSTFDYTITNMSDVKVWSTALSAALIEEEAADPWAMYKPSRIAVSFAPSAPAPSVGFPLATLVSRRAHIPLVIR